jgi:hypothetical protein
MRTALFLHGYFDSCRDSTSKGSDGFSHVHNRILKDNDVDIYIHSWDLENQSEIEDIYSPWIKRSVFEKQIDFRPVFYNNGLDKYPKRSGVTHFWNVLSQFYSVQESFKLVSDETEYDVWIKSRFDLGRINRSSSGPHNKNNPYAVQCINFDPTLDMSKVYMAKWQQKYLDEEGPADMWFYSGPENMKNFQSLYDISVRDIKYNSEYVEWAGPKHGGPINTIKAWKWFFVTTGLWEKKELLMTEWE